MNSFGFSPYKAEKKDCFKHGNIIGAGLLIGQIVPTVITVAIVVLLALTGKYSLTEAQEMIGGADVVASYGLNTLLCFLMFFLTFYLILKIMKRPVGDTCGFNKPQKNSMAIWCFGLCLFMILVGSLVTNVFNVFTQAVFGEEAYTPEIGDGTYTLFTFAFTFLNAAIMPALLEEFAFRGAILGIVRKFGDGVAIIFSSLAFALMHGNFGQIPYTFCLGLALAFTRVVTGSIWPCIFIHFFNNSLALLLPFVPESIIDPFNVGFNFFCMIFGLVSLFFLFKNGAMSRIKSVPTTLSSGGRFCRIFFSPCNIIWVIMMLISSLSFFKGV